METSKTKSDRKDNRCEYLSMSTDTSLVLFPTYGESQNGESQNMHVILQKIHDNMALIALSRQHSTPGNMHSNTIE